VRRKAFCLTLVIALMAGLSFAPMVEGSGVGAAAFLRRGVDARAMAMGGAHVAVVDGASSMYWNPAGLTRATNPQVGGMTTDLFGAELFLNYLAGAYPWQMGGSTEQTPSATLRLGAGASFTELATEVHAYDGDGKPVGEIRYSEALYCVGAGAWVPGLGHAGVVAKAYRFLAPRAGVGGQDATAFGLGFDVGLAAPVWEGLWLGLSAADVGNTAVQWRNTPTEPRDRVSGRYTGGAAYFAHDLFLEEDRLILAADYILEPLVDTHAFKAGIEYTFLFLSLRGGASMRPEVPLSFSAGVGVEMMQLSIDAAWVQNRELEAEGVGHTLVVSASFKF